MTEFNKDKQEIYDDIIKTGAKLLLIEESDFSELFIIILDRLEKENNCHIYSEIGKDFLKLSIIDKSKYSPIIKKNSFGSTKSYDIKNAIVYEYNDHDKIKKDIRFELTKIRNEKIDKLIK